MNPPDSTHPQVLSVTRLTQQLKRTLQARFQDIRVSGEISNLTRAHSGHLYLTLGDDHAQLKTVVWRSDAERIGFELADGMQVVCRGEIDIYPPRGTYQLIVRHIEPLGLGALQVALRQLHARLEAEGLFAAERKRALPRFPRRVAVVTSPAGAAIQDFLQVATRRWPALQVLVIPARVQGEGAAREIAEGVVVAGMLRDRPDVVVVTRGGGSAEDLWSFNDELVVRAIAECQIPVISGVGHEIDVTLSDLAADVRALTPSEAAELVVPLRLEFMQSLANIRKRMQGSLEIALARARERLTAIATRRVLAVPEEMLNVARRQVDELELRLDELVQRAHEQRTNRLSLVAERLHAISPLQVLARGYSVTQTVAGDSIRNADQLKTGQTICTQLAQGRLESIVQRIESGPSPSPVDVTNDSMDHLRSARVAGSRQKFQTVFKGSARIAIDASPIRVQHPATNSGNVPISRLSPLSGTSAPFDKPAGPSLSFKGKP